MKINLPKVKATAKTAASYIDKPANRAIVTTVVAGLVGSFGLHLPAGDVSMIVTGVVVVSTWLAR
jgi:hypothetical protein